jgi:predicted Zn-dependent protease
MYSDTYEFREIAINASNSKGISLYESFREIKTKRYLVGNKWIIGDFEIKQDYGSSENKNFEQCSSFRHENVNYWNKIRNILREYLEKFNNISIISKYIERSIKTNENICTEEKVILTLEVCKRKYSYIGNPMEIQDIINYIIERCEDLQGVSITSLWNLQGRSEAILDPEIVSSIFHYFIKDFLNGENPKVKLNERILGDITVIDNPLNQRCSGYHSFDDEGVKTKRSELIGDGYVQNYLGTRTSKYGEPGNGRGVLPEPDYFCMEIKGGDWKISEMFEETKDGIYASGVIRAEKVGNSVRIIPRVIMKGGKYIKVREIAIPYSELVNINAISKDVISVSVFDNYGAIAPFIRMPIRILLY